MFPLRNISMISIEIYVLSERDICGGAQKKNSNVMWTKILAYHLQTARLSVKNLVGT